MLLLPISLFVLFFPVSPLEAEHSRYTTNILGQPHHTLQAGKMVERLNKGGKEYNLPLLFRHLILSTVD